MLSRASVDAGRAFICLMLGEEAMIRGSVVWLATKIISCCLRQALRGVCFETLQLRCKNIYLM